jgi:hypothetical protein
MLAAMIVDKYEILQMGLCIECVSKFSVEEDLCWDCMYAKGARAAAHKGSTVSISVSSAWKSPRRVK